MGKVYQIDEQFNEIVRKDVKEKIAEAFISLAANLNQFKPLGVQQEVEVLYKEKASQMKTEINQFIDSLLVAMTEKAIGQGCVCQVPEAQEETQNQ